MNKATMKYSEISDGNCPSATNRLMSDFEEAPFDGRSRTYNRRRSYFWPVVIQLAILVVYTIIILAVSRRLLNQDCRPAYIYSPVREAIKYQKISYNGELQAENEFRGKPRPELDEAWLRLLKNNNIRLTEEELKKLNMTSVKLNDNTGYYGQISVYHHLHCLNYIRQVIHPEAYNTEDIDRDMHVDHCIDDIRSALMCQPDISMITFRWRRDFRTPWANFVLDQECVNWKALDQWVAKRAFSAFDQKSLVHPQLGIVFPLIDGNYEMSNKPEEIHIVFPEGYQES